MIDIERITKLAEALRKEAGHEDKEFPEPDDYYPQAGGDFLRSCADALDALIAENQRLRAALTEAAECIPITDKLLEEAADRIAVLTAALQELVACKDLKERMDERKLNGTVGEVGDLMTEYNRRKPLAWQAARNAIEGTP